MKNKIIIFILPFLFISHLLISQTPESEAYLSNTNNTYHSQIIQHYKGNTSVVLSRLSNGVYRFELVESNNPNWHYVDFPLNFIIRDFKILGDTVYFCGKDGNGGFIAYVNINDLFNATSQNNYGRISHIPHVTSLNKIITYYQDNLPGRVKVCAIGEVYEVYEAFPDYYNCIVELNINFPNPNSPPYNFYSVFRCFLNSAQEEIFDFNLTDNYIAILSVNTTTSYNGGYNFYYLRRLEKYNFFHQHTNRFFSNTLPFVGGLDNNFLIEHINRDKIFLSYPAVLNPFTPIYVNVIHKIDMQNSLFSPVFTLLFDDQNDIIKINDIKYDYNLDKFLLLKESIISTGKKEDVLWYIDNFQAPHIARELNIPNSVFNTNSIYFSSLSKRDNHFYRIAGSDGNGKLAYYNKNIDDFNKGSNCNFYDFKPVNEGEMPVNYLDDFFNMKYTLPPLTTPIVFEYNLSIPVFNVSNSQNECISY